MTKKIGFIGIGLMGLPMSKNLVKAGYNLTVFNRSKNKAEPLKEFGAKISNTLKDAVDGSDIVITMLTDDTAVDEVMNNTDFLESLGDSVIIIGKMEVRLNKGKVKKALWFQVD